MFIKQRKKVQQLIKRNAVKVFEFNARGGGRRHRVLPPCFVDKVCMVVVVPWNTTTTMLLYSMYILSHFPIPRKFTTVTLVLYWLLLVLLLCSEVFSRF